jgi:hypothetical protein
MHLHHRRMLPALGKLLAKGKCKYELFAGRFNHDSSLRTGKAWRTFGFCRGSGGLTEPEGATEMTTEARKIGNEPSLAARIANHDLTAQAGALVTIGLGWACLYLAVSQSWLMD